MKMRKNEYKPLLFTTTIRNPERMKQFMSIIVRYNGKILTNELIDEIVFDIVSAKLYIPYYVRKTADLLEKLQNDIPYTKNEIKTIIEKSPQNHKEAGFQKGWPSRFDTWYKFLKELGFVYYEMNKSIEVSEAGTKLALAVNEGYEHLENQIFLNSFSKYQRVNPYRRVSNDNKPLILLLNVIKELKKVFPDSAGISKKEIPLIICWKDNDYMRLVKKIVEIRSKYSFTPSNECIYEECKSELSLTVADEKRFKLDNILNELPDEFIRKMRLTGLISIRGMGRFIDINSLEDYKIKYILVNYSNIKKFSTEKEYFDYMKIIDSKLISSERNLTMNNDTKRMLFTKWVSSFDENILCSELKIVADCKKKSKHELFKYIDEPLRLEFLTSLLLQKHFNDIVVKPNYSIDDEGLPASYAIGGTPDIECLDEEGNILFEVTLLTGTQQCIREMPAIARHLQECIINYPNSFSIMLAPVIHHDTIEYSKFIKFKDNIDIKTLDIVSFADNINEMKNIREYNL